MVFLRGSNDLSAYLHVDAEENVLWDLNPMQVGYLSGE